MKSSMIPFKKKNKGQESDVVRCCLSDIKYVLDIDFLTGTKQYPALPYKIFQPNLKNPLRWSERLITTRGPALINRFEL